MSRTLNYVILLLFVSVSIVVAAVRPEWISDKNDFLRNFVNHEVLNVLGVILAITLASTANLHLVFNRIEEKYNTPGGLATSRSNLRKATYWLIGLFIFAISIVLTKPIAKSGETSEALFNMAAMLALLWHVLIMIAITQLVFAIGPDFQRKGTNADD